MDISFVDTTFRDGSQSLWAMGIRHKMMQAVAADLDRAQLAVIEVPANAIFFKKFVRDLKEDPWEIMRMLAREIPNTPKACMGGGFNLNSFGAATPPVLGELYWQIVADIGALQRLQTVANTADQLTRQFPGMLPKLQAMGYSIVIGISYSISPRHTDEYFLEKVRGSLAFNPAAIYLKDQGGPADGRRDPAVDSADDRDGRRHPGRAALALHDGPRALGVRRSGTTRGQGPALRGATAVGRVGPAVDPRHRA